ncbi:MAG: hypothetical protein AAF352_05920 [Pseudomonadota bacterium]
MRAALIRLHYYCEILPAAIASMRDLVDFVFVCWSPVSYAGEHAVFHYQGKLYRVPSLHEDALRTIQGIPNQDGKIKLLKAPRGTPHNGYNDFFTKISQYYPNIDQLILLEADMVLDPKTLSSIDHFWDQYTNYCFTTNQVNLWRNCDHYQTMPPGSLYTAGPIFYNLSWNGGILGKIGYSGILVDEAEEKKSPMVQLSKIYSYNLGACANYHTVQYRHFASSAYSKIINDDMPPEHWFDKYWNAAPLHPKRMILHVAQSVSETRYREYQGTDLHLTKTYKYLKFPTTESYDMPAHMREFLQTHKAPGV